MATISRAQMESAIHAGGSVLLGGVVISRIEDLPSEATLAGDDPAARAAARDSLLAAKAVLDEQLAKLDTAKPEPKVEPEAEPKPHREGADGSRESSKAEPETKITPKGK